LIATLLAVAIIVALTSLGHGLSAKFNGVAASLNSAGR
jgi:Flp pilus assembly pilin Flp